MSIEKIGSCKNSLCNKTHLDVEKATERGLQHRDYIAHCCRWTHVLKYLKKDTNVLDVGCGNAILAQIAYVNRYEVNYTGIDIRESMLEVADKRKLKKKPRLIQMDICKDKIPLKDNWADILTCFEVVEHIPESSLDFVLSELQRCVKPKGKVLLSTPNFDGKHQAANHPKEYEEEELRKYLEKYFVVKKQFGTFASQKDIKPVLTDEERKFWDKLREYYDVNMFSVLFAPNHPAESRNILWVLEKKATAKKDDLWEM